MAAPQRPSRRRVPRQLPSRRPSVPTWEAVPPINTPAVDPKLTEPMKAESNFPFQSTEPVKVPNPAKQVPEGAASMHPVMVLHQMKPGLLYNTNQTTRDNKPFFTVTADIDGKEFSGKGTNVKKAKFFLANTAILGLYGVESTFEISA
ncbi:interleukin enhancer-binding factor 3 homolog isoform X1 [Scylla paramamosain]|uniref:interleukin enhancer-binding factor 3 homolog isoform X1 n=1 Tax=Scylla paramamosain TaxID=85552 RepID=UPI003083763D